ncbi:unnamed protein product [Phaedon cochleariae]|uniref:THAP-type domain-containing protein n=1 Tax=Phaedon cochleariae TaxID=80249 RepID=A0A9N9SL26_PHACE|nr:unnamed protein product [Phaedon cochleariae]
MTDKCVVCGYRSRRGDCLSFHRFPDNIQRRQMWLNALNLEKSNKWHYVCGKHFNNNDYTVGLSGLRILNREAIPFMLVPQDFVDSSSESTITASVSSGRTITASISEDGTLTASEKGYFHEDTGIKRQEIADVENLFKIPERERLSIKDILETLIVKTWQVQQKHGKLNYGRKIHTLQQQNRRRKARVTSLKSVLNYLTQQNLLSNSALETIEASLPGPVVEVVKRILKGSKCQQYSPSLRAFALTLHFYSPRAYNYVREKFNKALPHPSTVSKWYQHINGSPGFTTESLNAIRGEVEENKLKDKATYANLVMDEMSIRKKVEWVENRFIGFVDFGNDFDSDSLCNISRLPNYGVTLVPCLISGVETRRELTERRLFR